MTTKPLTDRERVALEIVDTHGRRRGSVSAAFVAAQAGKGSIRSWSGVLSSLAAKGLIRAFVDGFVRGTFYLPKDEG